MWYTLQLIIYSFLIIFICHNLYIFYKDNMVENTFYDIHNTFNNDKGKSIPNDNIENVENNSQSMKNELQDFLNNQIENTDHNSSHVGFTSIEDIPIST